MLASEHTEHAAPPLLDSCAGERIVLRHPEDESPVRVNPPRLSDATPASWGGTEDAWDTTIGTHEMDPSDETRDFQTCKAYSPNQQEAVTETR